jgi:iron complex transport system substrate-binding protein
MKPNAGAMIAAAAAALLAAGGARAEGPRRHLGPPVPAQVRRVVTLAPSLSELVLALGAGERLVGVTRFDDDPRTAKLPRVGGFNDPEPEAVLALRPDLALAEPAPSNRGPVETLARLGIPIETFPLSTVAEIESAVEGAGALLGLREKAAELNARIEESRKAARKASEKKQRPRALLVFSLEPLVVAGPRSFAGELLADAGGTNASGDNQKPFFRMSAELAVRAQPEVIVLCGVEPTPGRPAIAGLEKVRLARLPSSALMHPGPRVPEALDDLTSVLRR